VKKSDISNRQESVSQYDHQQKKVRGQMPSSTKISSFGGMKGAGELGAQIGKVDKSRGQGDAWEIWGIVMGAGN